MQPLIRHKLKVIIAACFVLGVGVILGFAPHAIAAPAAITTNGGSSSGTGGGCYTSELSVNQVQNCAPPTGTVDNQGQPVDIGSNCYIVNSSTNPTVFQEIDCNKITAVTKGMYCGGPYTANGKVYDEPAVRTSIDIGCTGQGNPIIDMLFAVIRFLSLGVGIVVIASIVVAGIQYTTSRGDPQATSKALGRIRSAVGALLIYILAYAILNYVIPVGFFHLGS